MSLILPKPIIARTHRTWRVPPGMVIALVEDMEHRLWVVESCPVGTKFWTVEQAAQLELGTHTRTAFREAVELARQSKQVPTSASGSAVRSPKETTPSVRVHHHEKMVAKMPKKAKVRPVSVPTRKTLIGV